MPVRQLNITTVVIALIISLGLMLGGQYLYEKYYVKESVKEKIASVVKVDEVRIAKQEQPPTVYIRTSQIDDLQTVYQKVEKIVRQELGTDYQVVFLDRRTPKLTEIYENSQFAIQEAIATGSFQKMHRSVQNLAEANHVDYRVTVDSFNIYLQLRDGQGYLYEVIQRSPQLADNEKNYGQGGGGI
ncbi:MAG TPA: hypothetical protein GXX19_08260 [Syntrophomonadaceae bacterium]|nr:hypothetical protein [Syntrophomonadaceae bacterium]